MDDEFYQHCYVCFETENLIRCHRCVYRICERCILDEKISTVSPSLCRHDDCAYSYLTEEEIKRQNCFVCSKKGVDVRFQCGTCGSPSSIPLSDLEGTIQKLATQGTFEKKASIIDQKIIYFNIKDIDTGEIITIRFWHVDQFQNDGGVYHSIAL